MPARFMRRLSLLLLPLPVEKGLTMAPKEEKETDGMRGEESNAKRHLETREGESNNDERER